MRGQAAYAQAGQIHQCEEELGADLSVHIDHGLTPRTGSHFIRKQNSRLRKGQTKDSSVGQRGTKCLPHEVVERLSEKELYKLERQVY